MKTFHELTLDNGVPTEAGERAMELAYEALTGKCWHEMKPFYMPNRKEVGTNDKGTFSKNEAEEKWYSRLEVRKCIKCGHKVGYRVQVPHPALLTSLDAWPDILNKAGPLIYKTIMRKLLITSPMGERLPEPWEILRETLKTLEGDCLGCEGDMTLCVDKPCNKCLHGPHDSLTCEPYACTNGKIPLYDIWEGGK